MVLNTPFKDKSNAVWLGSARMMRLDWVGVNKISLRNFQNNEYDLINILIHLLIFIF